MLRDQELLISSGSIAIFTIDANGLFGEPAEELRCVDDLVSCVSEDLAVLFDDDLRKFVGFSDHDLECLTEDLSANTRSGLRPRLLRGVGGIEGHLYFLLTSEGDLCDGRFVARIHHCKALWR